MKKNILFFDDEEYVSSYMISNLEENYGWKEEKEIKFVSTIDKLLKELNNEEIVYDLFVLDVMIPNPLDNLKEHFSQEEWRILEESDGRNRGIGLAKRIRRMPKYNKVPILFLTAKPSISIPESDRNYTAFINKPASPSEISKTMNKLLKNL